MKFKLSFFVVLSLFTSCGYWINPRYVKMSQKTQAEYEVPKLSNLEEFYIEKGDYEIYSANVKKTKELISGSNKPYSLLVFYAHWCKPCHQDMPKLNEFDSNNQDSINLIFISSSDWLDRGKDKAYLERYKVRNKSSLIVDYKEYGSEFMNWNRIESFIKELEPERYGNQKDVNIGLPHYMLLNKKCELMIELGAPFEGVDCEAFTK